MPLKILLVKPPKPPETIGGEDVSLFEPVDLEYVAAAVRADHDVRIVDLRLGNSLQDVFSAFAPDVVGLTSYTVHVGIVIGLCEQVKTWDPDVLTVVGGHHATVLPEDFLLPVIDVVVMGEGIDVFREIVARFEKKEPFDGIAGVAFQRDGRVVKTACQAVTDLDAFPFPDRELTAKYRKHYHSGCMKPVASLRTSKGCPHRCKFCPLWRITGGRYLARDPEKVVQELAQIKEDCVFFVDDEAMINAARMKRLAKLIEEAGISKRYFICARSDTVARHPDLMAMWKDIGLERVLMGLEFFREKDLRDVGKGASLAENETAIKVLQNLGIEIHASFIVRPEFTRPDFRDFSRYCLDVGLSFASFWVLTPLPGSEFHDEVASQLITRKHEYHDCIHTLLPTALPLPEFYEELARLYKESVPFRQRLRLLSHFRWRDIPSAFFRGYRFYRRVKAAYRDYEA